MIKTNNGVISLKRLFQKIMLTHLKENPENKVKQVLKHLVHK